MARNWTFLGLLSDGERRAPALTYRTRVAMAIGVAMAASTVVAVVPAEPVRAMPDAESSEPVATEVSTAALCENISPLSCDAVPVTLPYSLTWSEDRGGVVDGNGVGTGFTMIDPPSANLTVDGGPSDAGLPGYEPSMLSVDTASGELRIVPGSGTQLRTPATNERANAQLNALGVGVDAADGLEIRTVLTGLDTLLTSLDHAQEAGIWFGLDEDDYVKLAVRSDDAGARDPALRVQLLVEVGGGRDGDPEQAPVSIVGPPLSSTAGALDELELVLRIDSAGSVSAEYGVDGQEPTVVADESLPEGATSLELPAEWMTVAAPGPFSGVFTSHFGSELGDALSARFASFDVAALEIPVVTETQSQDEPQVADPAPTGTQQLEEPQVSDPPPTETQQLEEPDESDPATVTEAPLGVLSADPASLSFTVEAGGIDGATIVVTGDGDSPELSVSTSLPWMTASTLSATEVSVSVDSTALEPGVYGGDVTLSAAGYTSLVVPVTLTVSEAASLSAASELEHGEVLYRVNAGGPEVGSVDGGPAWSADLVGSSPSPYVNHGFGNNRSYSAAAGTVSAPVGVPAGLFESERYDPLGGNEMVWSFPVDPGSYEVSLYLSEKFFGVKVAGGAAKRVFDVAVEGAVVLDDLDLWAQLGPAVGGVFTFDVPVDDDALTVEFLRLLENPTVDAIEVRRAGPPLSMLSADPAGLSLTVEAGGTDAAAIVVTGDGEVPVLSVSDPVSWLTVAAVSASEFAVSVDTAGLAVGVYESSVTFSAPGYASLDVPVSLTVEAIFGDGTVLYRVNAGGSEIMSNDDGPAWAADQIGSAPSTFVNDGPGNQDAYSVAAGTVTPAGGAPEALFDSGRYDPAGGNEMVWSFPVASGKAYQVTLFMSEKLYGVDPTSGSGTGARVFDVAIEDIVVLDDLDLFNALGPATGGAFAFAVPVADDFLTIEFLRSIGDPTIDAIEIRELSPDQDFPPIIAPIADVSVEAGGSVEVDITATDLDPIVLTLEDAPEFVTLVDAGNGTGVLTVAPGSGDAGTYAGVTVTATANGLSTSRAFTIDVLPPASPGLVLYRVNAGGSNVAAIDGGPDWTADTAFDPPVLATSGTSTSSSAVQPGATVPVSTPPQVFSTERWDPSTGEELSYDFPVAVGTPVDVRIFVGNGFSGTSAPGQRIFDIAVDGQPLATNLDLSATYGHLVGAMLPITVVSDGVVDIDFSRVVENPLVNAIELVVNQPIANTLSVSRENVSFGSVVVDGERVERVSLSNLGAPGDPVIATISAAVSGAGMSVSKAPATSLEPGQSTTVDVTFAPGSVGLVEGSLVISHSGVNSPLSVGLTGNGVSSVPIGFQVHGLGGAGLTNPTSLDFGPDGRLYVSQQNGLIKAYTLQRNDTADYSIVATENIDLVQGIKNHDDDGTLSTVANRQVTGLMATGTSLNPVLYVSSSDPRIAGGGTGADAGLDTNSGVISKLTWTGSAWLKVDMVRGLPRSEENHSTNGMTIDSTTNTMYVMSGGFTNKGAPSNNFAGTPEYALAAALLTVDLDAIEEMATKTDQYGQQYKYDLPTLNDPTRADKAGSAPTDPYADLNDPWGGNDGFNQSIIVPGGPVQVYSGGYRNAYDVVLTEAGRLYTWDNGPNNGWGGTPVGNGTPNCTNELNEANSGGKPDGLHHITGKGYYAGHPNPTRGNANSGYIQYVKQGGVWVAVGTYDWSEFPVRPVPLADIDPQECNYLSPANPTENGALATIGSSTNGMAEYTASNFGGAMKGDLLAAAFNGSIYRSVLSADGTQLVSNTALMQGFGSTPLDITAVGDSGPFPGTVWAVTYGSSSLVVFEPDDYDGGTAIVCTGFADGNDDDDDGYTNADEIAAGTDPCNASSVPSDFNGNSIPDVVDTDDDGDAIPDVADVFALDAANGLATPVALTCPPDFSDDTVSSCLRMSAGSRAPSILDLGFTGLMVNGDDYLNQFDPENVVPGGAAGVLAVKATTDGDATGALNTQDNGFQFGVLQPTVPFEVHSRIKSPFTSGTPVDGQAVGIQVGDGTQYDFVSLVLTANGGTGGVRFGHEIDDVFSVVAQPDVPGVVGTVDTDLFLTIDPVTKLITAEYSLDGGATRVLLGSTTVPATWVQAGTALAVGVMSTSGGAPSFNANWDFIDVTIADPDAEPFPSGESALIEILPGNTNINASTFTNGSFIVSNQSLNGVQIESIAADLRTAIIPDMVFDPLGTAGDPVAKGFTPNSGGAATGYVGFEYLNPHGGDSFDGYDGLGIEFEGFDPNETFTFSIDIDPTSIQGLPAPGPNESGSVSGLELAGSMITVTFSNGAVRTGYLFSDGSNGGARAIIAADLPAAPQLAMPGVVGGVTSIASQTLQVSGPAGATVKVLHVDSGLFVAPDATFPDPLYSNSIVSQLVSTITIDATGTASVPVTLRNLEGTSGINHFVSVIETAGPAGVTSQKLTVRYTP